MNKWIGIGNIVRDVELKQTQDGIACCGFTVAIKRPYTNANSEHVADYIDVQVWRRLAETCAKYLHKGSKVAVDGSIQTKNYTDGNGNKHFKTYVLAEKVEFIDRQQVQTDNETQPEPISEAEQGDLPF